SLRRSASRLASCMSVSSFGAVSPLVFFYFFFFNDPPPTEIYTLSLHDALPISDPAVLVRADREPRWEAGDVRREHVLAAHRDARSEEHTSELQSPYDLVCRLLLEKKKRKCRSYCQR